MNDFGVKVFVKNTGEFGYIVRRLNSQTYEIWLESKKELILDINEFVEIGKESNSQKTP
jgi:hypothetical protein